MKGTTLSNITVEKLILGGLGLATHTDGKKIVISGGVIPGSVVDIRVLKNRSNRIEGQMLRVVKRSPVEIDLPKNFQIYGGCPWLAIPYEKQLEIKESQIREVFHHAPELVEGATWHPIVASPEIYGYRNKLEFSWGTYISDREGVHDKYRFGFHASGQFDRIINCTNCVLGDEVANTIFHAFDAFARENRLPTYDVRTLTGFWRHLIIRRSKRTDETMVIVSANTNYLGEAQREEFRKTLRSFISQIPAITSAYLLHNTGKADIVQGRYDHISGTPTIIEKLLDLEFEISPKSFFQTNSGGAEKLYTVVAEMIGSSSQPSPRPSPKGRGSINTLFDLYSGTGTIGMVLAHLAKAVYSVELVPEACEDNRKNLHRNGIKNVTVINQPVEEFVKEWKGKNLKFEIGNLKGNDSKFENGNIDGRLKIEDGRLGVDVIVIDPPRAGMHPDAPEILRELAPKEIIYVSCNPATLARDLATICNENLYRVTDIAPVDMFPHTHHIETVVRLDIRK